MDKLLMLTDSPWLSGLIWVAVLMMALYFGRSSARRAIMSFARLIRGLLRLAARGVVSARESMAERNREVLLAQGREAKERLMSREFERITATVNRDLARYPETQRLLSETIQRIDEDHQNATDVPPEVPGWSRAVDAVAKVSAKADPTVKHVLEAIHGSLARAEAQSLAAYREASKKRHQLLSRMRPAWQTIQSTLKETDRAINSILERSRSVDRHMEEYEEIVRGSNHAVQMLSTSALVQFCISTLVMLIAIGGAVINFSLIARPMAEMVGGTSYIGPFQTANIAALVIILVEMSMGLFLMESLRITRLFPVISALPERTRLTMVWVSLGLLTTLASVEAGLAYMREVLLQDELATSSALRGVDAAMLSPDTMWITTAAQMGMGFVLPFALTFVAIPLESFIQTFRHVAGSVVMGVLNLLVMVLRLLGNAAWQAGVVVLHLYDLLIFAPLWLEGAVVRRRERAATRAAARMAQEHQDEGSAPREPEDSGSVTFRYGETPA
ncbi:MAG: hypothetical protein PVH91_03735 [Pseudomonadales bacterium]|jgi:hypothetical protein